MSLAVPWRIFTSYAVAWLYLAGLIAAAVVYATLSPHDQAAVLGWASTNVHNLRHDPVGCLVASAFVAQTFAGAWPALIVLAMFGANRVLGNWRTALVCTAGHVIGTLVSEGIVGYRVSRGLLPASSRYIIDVGPSYVVVAAIVVALLYGSWLARAAAALDLALLVVVGNIFGGLNNLDVAAVGHVTAMVVAVAVGSVLVWQLPSRQRGPVRLDQAVAPVPELSLPRVPAAERLPWVGWAVWPITTVPPAGSRVTCSTSWWRSLPGRASAFSARGSWR